MCHAAHTWPMCACGGLAAKEQDRDSKNTLLLETFQKHMFTTEVDNTWDAHVIKKFKKENKKFFLLQ